MRMTLHQKDMLEALKRIPKTAEFCAGDMKKLYGYPHKDAAKVLQQDRILCVYIQYSDPYFRAGKIRYRLRPDFDHWASAPYANV